MAISLKEGAKRALANAGYELKRRDALYSGMDKPFWHIYRACRPHSGVSRERMYALYKAVEYIAAAGIEGAFVECGVRYGGSSMAAALSFKHFGDMSRKLFLYDTYTGFPEPSAVDVNYYGRKAKEKWEKNQREGYNEWAYGPIDLVKRNMRSTGYPEEKTIFVKGLVEETIPATIPERIALLRLDTDWYESTYHEMHHLFPLLAPKGVLIVDDYGDWVGARKAVNQYLAEKGTTILLNRIDSTGVIAQKT